MNKIKFTLFVSFAITCANLFPSSATKQPQHNFHLRWCAPQQNRVKVQCIKQSERLLSPPYHQSGCDGWCCKRLLLSHSLARSLSAAICVSGIVAIIAVRKLKTFFSDCFPKGDVGCRLLKVPCCFVLVCALLTHTLCRYMHEQTCSKS